MLLCSALSARAECGGTWLAADAGLERSRWEESGAQGRPLLRETGSLRTVGLGVGGRCGDIPWLARLQRGGGLRQYRGLTASGAAVETESRIAQYRLEFTVLQPLGRALSAGGRVGYQRIHRQIASAGTALGYPERFDLWQSAAGARLLVHEGTAWQLAAQAWLGAGPPGRMQLNLPHADPTRLRLGSSRSQQFELQLSQGAPQAEPARWLWSAQLDCRRERFGAGPAQAVTRQGQPIGGAAQPATRQTSGALRVTVQRAF